MSVRVYSNELPLHFFDDFRAAGYLVRIQRFDVDTLLRGTPAARWLSRLAEWRNGRYFYSHLTDALRLALLFREGGALLCMCPHLMQTSMNGPRLDRLKAA